MSIMQHILRNIYYHILYIKYEPLMMHMVRMIGKPNDVAIKHTDISIFLSILEEPKILNTLTTN